MKEATSRGQNWFQPCPLEHEGKLHLPTAWSIFSFTEWLKKQTWRKKQWKAQERQPHLEGNPLSDSLSFSFRHQASADWAMFPFLQRWSNSISCSQLNKQISLICPSEESSFNPLSLQSDGVGHVWSAASRFNLCWWRNNSKMVFRSSNTWGGCKHNCAVLGGVIQTRAAEC